MIVDSGGSASAAGRRESVAPRPCAACSAAVTRSCSMIGRGSGDRAAEHFQGRVGRPRRKPGRDSASGKRRRTPPAPRRPVRRPGASASSLRKCFRPMSLTPASWGEMRDLDVIAAGVDPLAAATRAEPVGADRARHRRRTAQQAEGSAAGPVPRIAAAAAGKAASRSPRRSGLRSSARCRRPDRSWAGSSPPNPGHGADAVGAIDQGDLPLPIRFQAGQAAERLLQAAPQRASRPASGPAVAPPSGRGSSCAVNNRKALSKSSARNCDDVAAFGGQGFDRRRGGAQFVHAGGAAVQIDQHARPGRFAPAGGGWSWPARADRRPPLRPACRRGPGSGPGRRWP